jgi:hypothetical protein
MVIRRTVGIDNEQEQIMKVKVCSQCNCTIGKGCIEILRWKGDRYMGKYCSYECSRAAREAEQNVD